jgi:tRNA-splicing ligase RtcB (3'-phosphate/5'-hydroxy nucleic acid ligase)
MFIISEHPERGILKTPIYVWLPDLSYLDDGCLAQVLNLSEFPFASNRIVLMPDTHQGYGMPIGGVLATKDVVIPNAVGVDIGCGVAFVRTNLSYEAISAILLNKWVEQILNTVPQGFSHHRDKQKVKCIDEFRLRHTEQKMIKNLWNELENASFQMGTLGGGNHFIEFQADEANRLCLMVHSGSRNFGYQIARHFNQTARKKRKGWNSQIPASHELDYLPDQSEDGQSYLAWMNLARDFANENRSHMMQVILHILIKTFPTLEIVEEIDIHHNDANLEVHDHEAVWVHRKGAIKIKKDEKGIIPGAMGRSSYIVRGRGNSKAYHSCSHGAGRAMSRKLAYQTYSRDTVMKELTEHDMIIGKRRMKDVAEEAPMAYKDIDFVIDQQLDLIEIVTKLTGKAVIKG